MIDLPIVPGAYDVVYMRGATVSEAWLFQHYPTDHYAYGHRVLRENVVIGPGTTTLDIDIAPARVTGEVLYGGTTTFPGTPYYEEIDLYLRARDTGVLHFLEDVDFSSMMSGGQLISTTMRVFFSLGCRLDTTSPMYSRNSKRRRASLTWSTAICLKLWIRCAAR